MLNEKKVFKFPDGKGGSYWQVQMPDGKWLPSDEEGNLIDPPVEEQNSPLAKRNDLIQKAVTQKRSRSKSSALRRDRERVNTCINFYVSESLAKKIRLYLVWRTIQQGRTVSRSEVVTKAVEVYMEKDPGFKDFLNKMQED